MIKVLHSNRLDFSDERQFPTPCIVRDREHGKPYVLFAVEYKQMRKYNAVSLNGEDDLYFQYPQDYTTVDKEFLIMPVGYVMTIKQV